MGLLEIDVGESPDTVVANLESSDIPFIPELLLQAAVFLICRTISLGNFTASLIIATALF